MYYVIQVKTGKEQKAIDDILKNKPDDASFDVFAPYRKSLRKYKGELREVIERCFPGYIFVETSDVKKLFFELYWIPGFTKLLGREADTYNPNLILIEGVSKEGLGLAIMNRLVRASSYNYIER